MQAYLILAHRSRHAVCDLFRSIYRTDDLFLIHVDRKAPLELRAVARGLAAAFGNVQGVEGRYCSWGGFSLVAVTMAAIRQALGCAQGWRHFVLLSEQHLPLVPASAIADALVPGVSDIEMDRVETMYASGRRDVMNRFAYAYRELAGVGSFATERAAPPPPADLHIGSQWMVLARGLCEAIAAAEDEVARVFSRSLLADETALQTLAFRMQGEGAPVFGRNRTWIATPARTGDHSMIFAERHFFEARDAGNHLFIRKRPDVLPPAVQSVVEAEAAFTPAELTAILSSGYVTELDRKARVTPEELVWRLRGELGLDAGDLRIEAFYAPSNGPRCYIRFRYPGSPPPLRLCLLSEDGVGFKIVLAMSAEWRDDFDAVSLFGFETSVIRARVYDLAYQHEIHLGDEVAHGFVGLQKFSDVATLAAVLRRYLTVFADVGAKLC